MSLVSNHKVTFSKTPKSTIEVRLEKRLKRLEEKIGIRESAASDYQELTPSNQLRYLKSWLEDNSGINIELDGIGLRES